MSDEKLIVYRVQALDRGHYVDQSEFRTELEAVNEAVRIGGKARVKCLTFYKTATSWALISKTEVWHSPKETK